MWQMTFLLQEEDDIISGGLLGFNLFVYLRDGIGAHTRPLLEAAEMCSWAALL